MEHTILSGLGVLTRKQLAHCLKVNEDTIARWEAEHDFPGRPAGRVTLYDVEQIKKWIADRPKR